MRSIHVYTQDANSTVYILEDTNEAVQAISGYTKEDEPGQHAPHDAYATLEKGTIADGVFHGNGDFLYWKPGADLDKGALQNWVDAASAYMLLGKGNVPLITQG